MLFKRTALVAIALSALALALPTTAGAQPDAEAIEYLNDEDLSGPTRGDGRYSRLGIESTLNFVSNDNVIGQNDGTSIHVGGGLDGGLDFIRGDHALRNTLTYNTSWSRTPALETFIKNNDAVDAESIYNYYLTDWAGPYARVSVETSALPTNQRTADAKDYRINFEDGTSQLDATDNLRLADPFRPISFFESVGATLEPVNDEAIRTTFRLGFGARQTLASGVLDITDDTNDDGEVIVNELRNAIQAGAEAFAGVQGAFPERRLSYRAGATALVPFINNDDTDRSAIDLTRVGITAQARMDLFSWMGFTYRASVLNDPQLLDSAQIQNSFLLTFNYTLTDAGE